jgi:hypothetical protein
MFLKNHPAGGQAGCRENSDNKGRKKLLELTCFWHVEVVSCMHFMKSYTFSTLGFFGMSIKPP